MLSPEDTIAAVSSGAVCAGETIIRLSGPETFDVADAITPSGISIGREVAIQQVVIDVDDDLGLEANFYKFPSPRSYTGDDIIEIHICTAADVIEKIIEKLFSCGCRCAEPGEFTYRAYINGKMYLSQAEAVAEIVTSSNSYQLTAAENLLAGSLSRKVSQIRSDILELLSLLEAEMDFSDEDIEFIGRKEAISRTGKISVELGELLAGAISSEETIDAVAAGIAGVPNAGKSSLLNALLGFEASIVSLQPSATRDVLKHILRFDKCRCVLFDCAGVKLPASGLLDELANLAAVTALNSAAIVLFCVDVTREDFAEELSVLEHIKPKQILFVATKTDLVAAGGLDIRIKKLNEIFRAEFLPVSSRTGNGLAELGEIIQRKIITAAAGGSESGGHTAITQRHRQSVSEAIENIAFVSEQLNENSNEIAAMFLRSAIENLRTIEAENIDEQILDSIFSRFCIGK